MELARMLLDAFIKKNSVVDTTVTPAHRFAKEQAVAFARNVLDLMKKRYLTSAVFRDGMENLHSLGIYWKDIDESVARVRRSMPSSSLHVLPSPR